MFYNDRDYFSARKQFYRNTLISVIVFAVFLTIACIFMITWPFWVGLAFLFIGVSLFIFIWGIYAAPVLRYSNLIRDFITGRSRELIGTVKSVSEKPFYKESKLYFYEIIVDEDEVERMLFYDPNLGKPNLAAGNTYKFIMHEFYVIGVDPT